MLSAMMEEDRVALCGSKGVPDPSRSAYRGGHTQSWVTLGGRKIAVSRPRVRAVDAAELGLPTFAWAAQTDPLNAATIAAISAGVSTRRYRTTLDCLPLGGKVRVWVCVAFGGIVGSVILGVCFNQFSLP